MSEPVDQEVEAIKAVLTALAPLSERARASVLDYVVRRLGIGPMPSSPLAPTPAAEGDRPPMRTETAIAAAGPVHITQFKEEKAPRSANEMAAVVAYYLANIAQPSDRKQTINQKDVETYFKIAGFPLPRHVRQTLPNAKNAGYFDLVGDGEYRLNAVGHNLVAHSLPPPPGQKRRGRPSGKPARTKKQRKP